MHPTACKPSEASPSEPPFPELLISEDVALPQQQPEQWHQPKCPTQCRIKGDGLIPFSFHLPTHTKETCKVHFEVKLLAARWDAREDTAQHKHAMARGPNQWEKPKGETDLLPKIRAPVDVAGGRCCATWSATKSPCLAKFTKTLVRHIDSPHWEELNMDITVLAASAVKSSFFYPDAAFGHACINLGNYVPVTGDVTCTYSSTFSTEPHPRRFPGFELDVEIRVLPHESERKTSAASDAVASALGQLEMGPAAPELQFNLEAQQCLFEPGAYIRVAVPPAEMVMPCTLLHGRSLLEICHADAPNRIGKVTQIRPDASGLYLVRVKADSDIKWRLQSKCSSRCQTSVPQNNAVFCLFPNARTADEDARQAAEETDLAKKAAAAAVAVRNIRKIDEGKKRALASASTPIRITFDQLNVVRVRQCFLLSKPVICGIVRRLRTQWCLEGLVFERLSNGPDGHEEDIYANINFLLKPDVIALLNRSFGFHNPDQECQRQRLEGILKTILTVRNWWAHVRVSVSNFREALIALQDFISMVPPALWADDCDVLRTRLGHMLSTLTPNPQIQVDMTLTIDEIAYFYFGQACRFLSELCCHVMKHRPLLTFSVLLKQQMDSKKTHFRQKDVVEVRDVTSALIALKESKQHSEKEIEARGREDNRFEFREMDFPFECKTIDIVRNSFAHLSSGCNVIMVVLALGSLSHMFSIVSDLISADASPPGDGALKHLLERQSIVAEWQAELLGRTDMVDAVFLIESICKSNHDQLDRCEYAALASDSYRKFRLLATGEVTGTTQASFSSANLHACDAKHFRSILDFISVVPAEFRQCADSAVQWLMRSVVLDVGLSTNSRDMEQRIKNQKWLYDCIKKSFIKFGLPDIDERIHSVEQGTGVVQKAVVVLQKMRESECTRVMEDISEYIDHMGTRLPDLPGESKSGWDKLVQASSVSLNSTDWKKMPCAFLPSFHDCVRGSRGFSTHTPQELFKRCKFVLRPLLHLPPGDHLTTHDGIPGVEACLSPLHYFDTLAHLAVLASSYLHSDKQERLRFQKSFPIVVLESDDSQAGLCAIVFPALGGCFGREMENVTLNDLIRPVFLSSYTRRHSPIIMVHGLPGTGKSFLVDHVLNRMSNEFQDSQLSMYSHKIQGGLGRAAVREGLFKLGLSLCDKLGLDAEASMDDVLGSRTKQPRLRNFLRRQRFVVYVDDVDEEGLAELLLHVPQSVQPCCVVLTSQIKLSSADRFRRLDFIDVELGCFLREISLQLVDNVCGSCKLYASEESVPLRLEIRNWMYKDVFESLADLPLVVRLFAEWLKEELDMANEDETDFDLIALQLRWQQESQRVVDSSVSGNRGLPATVRLLLHNLNSLPDAQFKDDAICFLKIMSLSDPNDVNLWSLFDPEVPFLFVPKSWCRDLPQLHLKKNFEEIKRKINAVLSPSDPDRRIPLMQQLADPKFSFRDFFDRVLQKAPLLTKREGVNKNCPHFIISMHQLIQKAIIAQWRFDLPESDVILLELLDSRIQNPSKSIHPVTNDYYLRIAHTAKLMLHNLEDNNSKFQGFVDESHQNSPFAHSRSSPLTEFIEELRVSLRFGQARIGGSHELGQYWMQLSSLAGLFQKLGLEHESFALVSEVLEDQRFQLVSMFTFNRVASHQLIYSQSLNTCEHRWFYILMKLQVEVEHEAYSKQARRGKGILLQTSKLRKVAPAACDQMEYFCAECTKIFRQVRQRVEEGSLEEQVEARLWLERAFVSLGTLSYLLEESDIRENTNLRQSAREISREIYEFLKIPKHLQEQRAGRDLCAGCHDLLKVKMLIQRNFFDITHRQETSRRPFRHRVDFLDYARNWVCKELAESCLQHALLLPLTPESNRFKILERSIHWAHESERCANATRAGDDVNVAYRKKLLARCFGAHEEFKKSLFYHSLALISARKYHDLRGSRTSREWLNDTQCRMWATLRHYQARQPPGVSAVEQYLEWLKDGFAELKAECTEEELKHLPFLDPFDEKYFQSCQSCQRNFDGLLCPRQIEPILKETLIEHYEIHSMLLERKLQGGYFAWHQGIDDACFSRAEVQQRRRVFDFFVTNMTRNGLNSDPDLFQCAPEVQQLFWQMMMEDLRAPAKCKGSWGMPAVSEWNLFDLDSTTQQLYPLSLPSLQALLDDFEKVLSDDRTRRNFFKIAFATEEQIWVFRVLQCATFDQRAAIITEMEYKTNLKASQHMLKFLFQTTDIKRSQVQQKALDFVSGRKVTSYDVLAPLILICAECNNRCLLLDYWNNGLIKYKKEWPGSDLKNQVDVCFRALNSPNLAWIQLFVLINPEGQLRRGSVSEAHTVGLADGAEEYSCFVSGFPENTTKADIEHLFRMIGLNCSKITFKPKKVVTAVKVFFNTCHERDQAIAMDQFVLRSGDKPISVQLRLVQPSICGIGVTLVCKETKWKLNPEFDTAGVYISEVLPGKGAAAAGLPVPCRLCSVDGRDINMDMELARQLLFGIEGTEVKVVVKDAKSLKAYFQVKRLR